MSEVKAENKNDSKNVLITKEMNFQTYDSQAPRYDYRMLTPSNTATNTYTVGASTQHIVEFKIPITVINWKKTKLVWKMTIPESATADYAIYVYRDKQTLINSINLSLINGASLVDYNFVHMYNNIGLLRDTPYDEFKHRDWMNIVRPSNDAVTDNTYSYLSTFEADNVYGKTAGANYESISLYEPQHLKKGATRNGTGAGNVTQYFELSLGDLVDTEFSLDKDSLYPSEAILKITMNNKYAMAYEYNTVANTTSSLGGTIDITISQLYLKLAVQQNVELQRSLSASLVQSKLQYNLPFIIPYKFNVNSTQADLSVSFNSAFARKLSHIVVVNYTGGATGASMYNNNNYNGTIIKSYRTYLNSQPLYSNDIWCYQPANTSAVGNELTDWDVMKDVLEGSVYLNRGQYQKMWFHQDSFSVHENRLCCVNLSKKNDGGGLDLANLGNSVNYQFVAKLSAQTNIDWYIFLVFNRKITFSPEGFVSE